MSCRSYLLTSLIGHVVILLVLVLTLEFQKPLPVLNNTNHNDTISAVILGDTPESKIVPEKIAPHPQAEQQKAQQLAAARAAAIALKAKQKEDAEKKRQQEQFAKALLEDIKRQQQKKQALKEKALKSQFEKTLQEQSEKTLRQQLLNEDIRLKSKEKRLSQGEVNKYKALIIQAISDNWLIPTGVNKKLYCELMIRLAPGGNVLDVQVTRSSGDKMLDSSARNAVFKASPLPVPKDIDAFEPFRHFVLKVKPEYVLSADKS